MAISVAKFKINLPKIEFFDEFLLSSQLLFYKVGNTVAKYAKKDRFLKNVLIALCVTFFNLLRLFCNYDMG